MDAIKMNNCFIKIFEIATLRAFYSGLMWLAAMF